jgi:hypothetical protein
MSESIMRSVITSLLQASQPNPTRPERSPSIEAAGTPCKKASTPRRKSRLSNSLAAVSAEGSPSWNSKVPSRESTRSGVMIFDGIGVL